MESKELERRAWSPGEVAQGSGDVVVTVLAQQAQQGIAQRGERFGSRAGAHKVSLPRLAHLLNMEQLAEVNRLVLDFLAKQRERL